MALHRLVPLWLGIVLAIFVGGCSGDDTVGGTTTDSGVADTFTPHVDAGTPDTYVPPPPPPPATHAIGGTVIGLEGAGLILQNNGGETVAVGSNGAFHFATSLAEGKPYAVTVLRQPASPAQECVVSGATGTVGKADVSTIVVNCATNTFTVGGTVSGLAGTLGLKLNGTTNLSVTANGTFAFPTGLVDGAPYTVTIATLPTSPDQACVLTNGTGFIASANVTNVSVSCTTRNYAVGGTVKGLVAGGLVLTNNNQADVTVNSDGTFVFPQQFPSGSTYNVTVKQNPTFPAQTCTVQNGSGIISNAAIADIQVTCVTQSYTVGGTISGLAGSGLVLVLNGGEQINASGSSFTFQTKLASGTSYDVEILAQPTNPWQTCVATNNSGTVLTSNVVVTIACTTNTYHVKATVTGLLGTGLVIQNGTDTIGVGSDNTYTFPTVVASGGSYAVSVPTQPTNPTQSCTVSSASGPVTNGDVTAVVNCSTTSFTIGGHAIGSGGTVVLRNTVNNTTASATPSTTPGTSYTFGTTVPSNGTYNITVDTAPAGQSCVVSNPSGAVTSANITNIDVTCSATTVAWGGTETFDGVTAPALAPGWTTSATGADSPFTSVTNRADTAPNAVFTPDPGNVGNAYLVSPTLTVPSAGSPAVSFRHWYTTESTFDGCVLEISINGGAFVDITALAGGGFTAGGYNQTISTSFSSPIGGRQAWASDSGAFITSTATMPTASRGQPVQLRWRFASDNSVSRTGWWIDTISFQ